MRFALRPRFSAELFVAELAAVRQWSLGRRTVFLTPTRALAEEQYEYLKRTYEPLGLRVAVATRERRRHDDDILQDRFDFAVMVYEKLKAFLCARPGLLAELGLVVVDELQILADASRGDTVDLLLTRVALSEPPVQLVALSGVLADSDEAKLALWLRAELLTSEQRPLELREGVYCLATRTFTWREVNSGRESTERIDSMEILESMARAPELEESEKYQPAAEHLCLQFLARQEQTLVFVPTRDWSETWAQRLAEAHKGAPAETALAELATMEPTESRDLLEQCFRRGIGFHNSRLPLEMRRLVEREFNAGNLRVLFATSTLAQGVNLSASNVIVVPVMVETTAGGGLLEIRQSASARYRALNCREARNMLGRAARLGFTGGPSFGRAILLARDEKHAEELMRRCVWSDVEELRPPFQGRQVRRMVLDLVAGRYAAGEADLRHWLARTWAAHVQFSGDSDRLRLLAGDAVEDLQLAGAVAIQDGAVTPTALGRRAAASGVSHTSAAQFERWCRVWAERQDSGALETADGPHELEILALCAVTPDGQELSVDSGLLRGERPPLALAALRPQFEALGWNPEIAAAVVHETLFGPGGLTTEARAMVRKALLASAWTSALPTREIETAYRTSAGTLAALGAHLAWLAQSLAVVAEGTGLSASKVERINSLARRLPLGLPLGGDSLTTPPDSVCRPRSELLALLPPPPNPNPDQNPDQNRPSDLAPAPQGQPLPIQPPQALAPVVPVASNRPLPELRIDSRHPGQIWFRGTSLLLTELPWKLLYLLAQSPEHVIDYQDIKLHLWQTHSREDRQIVEHRGKILDALETVCSRAEAKRLVETVRKRGLKLNIQPAQLSISG